MHRVFGLLALAAAGLGLFLLLVPDPGPSGGFAQMSEHAPVGYGGWALGLLTGLVLAWLARVEWSSLPERIAAWLRLQRRRLALVVLGGLFASILLLF
ncbi:MAG TPA: hypothetical protein VFA64_05525 [Hyphomicrobiaceae bacterium]|nr:hypothetical protein [Hyphomicrobiaceae bacterium]